MHHGLGIARTRIRHTRHTRASAACKGLSLDQPHVALELPSNEAVRAAVEAGMCATAISASVAAPSIEAGLLHLVGYMLPDREFCAVRHAERQGSRAAQAWLTALSRR